MEKEPRDMPPRRRDEESDWHVLVEVTCEGCGCSFFEAKDDPAIVWEPGAAWDEGCHDRDCHCHTQAVIGRRRD